MHAKKLDTHEDLDDSGVTSAARVGVRVHRMYREEAGAILCPTCDEVSQVCQRVLWA